MRDFAERITRFKPFQVTLYAIPYLLLTYVLSFPLNLYQNFYREHQYGLATQSFLPWFGEQLMGLGVTLIGGTLLLIVLYAVFRRAPRTWWIWGTIVTVIFLFAGTFISPVYIEPLFNTYKPVTKPEIREPILAMAQANQIPVTQVFEVDASRQTTRVSANVAGFLGTTRIALNDNLLKQCTVPEIRMVMAHEMGHYVLNHGAKLLTYSGIFILVGFALTRTLFRRRREALGKQMGGSRHCRSGRASLARLDPEHIYFCCDSVVKYGRARDGTRSGCFRNQHRSGTRWNGESRAEARYLSQTRPDTTRGIHLLRSSKRPLPYPDGNGLESGKSAGRRINNC